MIGYDNRAGTTFTDGPGRTWEWKFVPKDMLFSHFSIQRSAEMRIEPHRWFFGNKVVCRKDMYLVMGEDREECRRLTTAAAWAIATRPWRLEVDAWKSWFNVDVGLVEGLHKRWWE